MIKDLFRIKGIKRIILEPYEVKVEFICPFFEDRDDEFVSYEVRFIDKITVSGTEHNGESLLSLILKNHKLGQCSL